MEQEELIGATRRDYESLQQEINRIRAETDSDKKGLSQVCLAHAPHELHNAKLLRLFRYWKNSLLTTVRSIKK